MSVKLVINLMSIYDVLAVLQSQFHVFSIEQQQEEQLIPIWSCWSWYVAVDDDSHDGSIDYSVMSLCASVLAELLFFFLHSRVRTPSYVCMHSVSLLCTRAPVKSNSFLSYVKLWKCCGFYGGHYSNIFAHKLRIRYIVCKDQILCVRGIITIFSVVIPLQPTTNFQRSCITASLNCKNINSWETLVMLHSLSHWCSTVIRWWVYRQKQENELACNQCKVM